MQVARSLIFSDIHLLARRATRSSLQALHPLYVLAEALRIDVSDWGGLTLSDPTTVLIPTYLQEVQNRFMHQKSSPISRNFTTRSVFWFSYTGLASYQAGTWTSSDLR